MKHEALPVEARRDGQERRYTEVHGPAPLILLLGMVPLSLAAALPVDPNSMDTCPLHACMRDYFARLRVHRMVQRTVMMFSENRMNVRISLPHSRRREFHAGAGGHAQTHLAVPSPHG
jgi:hypothetical protein